jgi:hypothetical protein
MGKLFDLRVFYLRAYFQERNYRVNREVAVLTFRLLDYAWESERSEVHEVTVQHVTQNIEWMSK